MQIKGTCKCCGKEYMRAGMLKHLNSCPKRECEDESQEYFDLLVTSDYPKGYWLMVEIKADALLQDLDQFLRDIWLECCGHLSSFSIGDFDYDSYTGNSFGWGRPTRSQVIKLSKVLQPGDVISYEYDFGSSTDLTIKVLNIHKGEKRREKTKLLARNNMPKHICDVCGKEEAAYINSFIYSEETPVFFCQHCGAKYTGEDYDEKEIDDEDIDSEEEGEVYLLSVCNSPRMGVCGYEGSFKYPD